MSGLCLISYKKSSFTWLGGGALPQSSLGDVPLLSCGNKMLHKLLWELGKSLGEAKGDWHKLLHQVEHTGQRHHLCPRAPAWALAPSMCLHSQQLVIQMIQIRTCFSFAELAS